MFIKIILSLIFMFNFSSILLAQEKVNLQLSWKYQFQFAGYYMAKEKGFYNDIGIDANIKEFDFSIDTMSDTLKQKSDFAGDFTYEKNIYFG